MLIFFKPTEFLDPFVAFDSGQVFYFIFCHDVKPPLFFRFLFLHHFSFWHCTRRRIYRVWYKGDEGLLRHAEAGSSASH